MRDRRIEGGTALADNPEVYVYRLCDGPGVLWESLGWIDSRQNNGELLKDATIKIYEDNADLTTPVVGSRILRNPGPHQPAFQARTWQRRYVHPAVLENDEFRQFLSEPMDDGQPYSPDLLREQKTNGLLKQCMCNDGQCVTI